MSFKPGITSPILQYRFRVSFLSELDLGSEFILTQTVRSLTYNLVKKELKINLLQTASFGEVNVLDFHSRNYHDILVDMFYNSEDSVSSLLFLNCKMVDHLCNLDYAESDISTHHVIFNYNSINETTPTKWIDGVPDLPGKPKHTKEDGLTPQEVIEKIKKSKKK